MGVNVDCESVIDLAEQYGFSATKLMNSEEIHKNRHFNERKAVWKFNDPLWGDLCYPFALQLDKTPGRIKWSMRPVGFDNEHVFRRVLGIYEDELEELYKKGVVGKWDDRIPATSPPPDWDGKKGLFY